MTKILAGAAVAALVAMHRNPDLYPPPYTADVHPNEVEGYRAAGWEGGPRPHPNDPENMNRDQLIEATLVAVRDDLARASDDDLRDALRNYNIRQALGVADASILGQGDPADDDASSAVADTSKGLTKPEIIADLEGMNIEFDPSRSKADLLKLRNEARANRDGEASVAAAAAGAAAAAAAATHAELDAGLDTAPGVA